MTTDIPINIGIGARKNAGSIGTMIKAGSNGLEYVDASGSFAFWITLLYHSKLYQSMDDAARGGLSEPLDLVKLALGERVLIKLRGDRTVSGVLHAYDAHMNLVLSQVEESIHIVDVSDEGNPSPPRVERRNLEMLFVRGDGVILISPTQQ